MGVTKTAGEVEGAPAAAATIAARPRRGAEIVRETAATAGIEGGRTAVARAAPADGEVLVPRRPGVAAERMTTVITGGGAERRAARDGGGTAAVGGESVTGAEIAEKAAVVPSVTGAGTAVGDVRRRTNTVVVARRAGVATEGEILAAPGTAAAGNGVVNPQAVRRKAAAQAVVPP